MTPDARPGEIGRDAATYDRDAYVEVLIAATWEKQGAAAAARIIARLDEPFLRAHGADVDGADGGGIAEVERRLAALIAYCRDEVRPRVERLERGLLGIAAAGADPAHATWRATAVAFWPVLRAAVARDHRSVWLKAHRLCCLYDRLDPGGRAIVDAQHGPLRDPDDRTAAALRELWPGAHLRAIDVRAAALGLTPARPARRPHRTAA